MEPELSTDLERKFQKELNAGTVGLLLLATLAKATEPRYAYEIAKELEDKAPIAKLGTLYPALRSMESVGLLEGKTEPSVSGPPRKYYSITQMGRDMLKRWLEQWRNTRQCVDNVLEGVRYE